MSLFQILATLFALWMIYSISIHARRKLFSSVEFTMWVSIWILFIVIAIFPDLLLGISDKLNFGRVFDLLTVGAFLILTTMVFVSYFSQQQLKKRINDLVQELATNDGLKFLKEDEKSKKTSK
jgi:hypothetical protein